MNVSFKPFSEINYLSSRDIAYQTGDDRLASFYKYSVDLDAFAEVINNKKKQNINRSRLVEVIADQYKDFQLSDLQKKNIELLAEDNTFTIITAHQPSLLTGPCTTSIRLLPR